eukprot:scaffold101476_cov69-Phaeocystis_antarctica.AAC.1
MAPKLARRGACPLDVPLLRHPQRHVEAVGRRLVEPELIAKAAVVEGIREAARTELRHERRAWALHCEHTDDVMIEIEATHRKLLASLAIKRKVVDHARGLDGAQHGRQIGDRHTGSRAPPQIGSRGSTVAASIFAHERPQISSSWIGNNRVHHDTRACVPERHHERLAPVEAEPTPAVVTLERSGVRERDGPIRCEIDKEPRGTVVAVCSCKYS